VRTFLIVSLLALSMGCKDKPKRKAPPSNPSEATATPGGKPGQPAPDLELPRSAGGPPKKTTAKHTKADYERLSKLSYPGFINQPRTVGDNVMEVRQITNGHPRYWVTVTIQPCLDCTPMDIEKWKGKEDELKVLLGALKNKPGVKFELGAARLAGAPIMFTYQFGAAQTGSDEGGTQTSFTNAFAMYYNDGINQIRVVAEYKDDPKSMEEIAKIAPKSDLEVLALAFLDVYTHEW
jgi:hypothetical protein